MAKKKEQFRAVPKQCAYCGGPSSTRDHVFPEAIFTVLDKQMITVPACKQCNQAKKEYDEFLRDFLAVDSRTEGHPAASEKFWEEFQRASLARQSKLSKRISQEAVLEFAIHPDRTSFVPVFTVQVEHEFDRAINFIVRGLTYYQMKERVDEDADIQVGILNKTQATNVAKMMEDRGGIIGVFRKGDAIVDWVLQYADANHSIWMFCFYGGLFVLVTVQPSTVSALADGSLSLSELVGPITKRALGSGEEASETHDLKQSSRQPA